MQQVNSLLTRPIVRTFIDDEELDLPNLNSVHFAVIELEKIQLLLMLEKQRKIVVDI